MALPSAPKNGSEQRRFPRYSMALDVTFGPMSASGAKPKKSELTRTVTVNLSLGGLCLYSSVRYPIGTPMSCVVAIPGRPTLIDLTGTVVWFHRMEQETHEYKLGVEFANVSAEARAGLQSLFDDPPAMAPSRSARVLLVEDDAELRLALKLRLESTGFDVLTASDGLDALRKGREEKPHLIILDLMLPQLNGLEVCRLLKFDQKFQHIPIILFSARCRREDIDMGLTAGADAYVTKPVSGQELIAKVEELLRVGRS